MPREWVTYTWWNEPPRSETEHEIGGDYIAFLYTSSDDPHLLVVYQPEFFSAPRTFDVVDVGGSDGVVLRRV